MNLELLEAVSHKSLKLLNLATSQVFFARIVKECPEKFHAITSKKLFLKKSLGTKVIVKNFAKFTERICAGVSFWKCFELTPQHRCFPANFAKLFRAGFLKNTSVWLVLWWTQSCSCKYLQWYLVLHIMLQWDLYVWNIG